MIVSWYDALQCEGYTVNSDNSVCKTREGRNEQDKIRKDQTRKDRTEQDRT